MNIFYDNYHDNAYHYTTPEEWYEYGIHSFIAMCRHFGFPGEILDKDDMKEIFHYEEFPKSTILVKPGDHDSRLFYIVSGAVKIYQLDADREERVNILLNEGNLCTSMENFLYEDENHMYLKTIQSVRALVTNRAKLFRDWGPEKNMMLKEIITRIVTKRLTFHLKLDRILRMNAKEKVIAFYQVFPTMVDYYFDRDIASLLDIRHENFSRIKKEIEAGDE